MVSGSFYTQKTIFSIVHNINNNTFKSLFLLHVILIYTYVSYTLMPFLFIWIIHLCNYTVLYKLRYGTYIFSSL